MSFFKITSTKLACLFSLTLFATSGCEEFDVMPGQPGNSATTGTPNTGSTTTGTATETAPSAGSACDYSVPSACGSDASLFCRIDLTAQCGATSSRGVCDTRPEACTREYLPVCGCDGKTYSNACTAAAAGVSISKNGECSPEPEPGDESKEGENCGGFAGLACEPNLFCNYPISAQCGAGDAFGTCAVKPQVCTREYAPVCGCDDKTYSNACNAAAAGVSVASEGECKAKPGPGDESKEGENCGGIAGLACESNLFCNYPISAQCGAGDAFGTCASKPQVCTREYAPVCGCDDKTYSNACNAAAAGVSVASEGECKAKPKEPGKDGDSCGGMAGLTCNKGLFCEYPKSANCGRADAMGSCAVAPEVCNEIWSPVCGCDGKTYDNECKAASHEVSVDYDGECKGDVGNQGDACGSRGMPACAEDLFCNFPESAACGAADAPGVCDERPTACYEIYQPVCGCDGKTYSNDCKAQQAGVSIESQGACTTVVKKGEACGAMTGGVCEGDLFCEYPVSAQCGNIGDPGACAQKPDSCIEIYDPVCGCDGKTYGNSCKAAEAGASVASNGACK